MDYRKHIWLAHSIKIIDIIFIALLLVKKRTVSIWVSILRKRAVVVIIIIIIMAITDKVSLSLSKRMVY